MPWKLRGKGHRQLSRNGGLPSNEANVALVPGGDFGHDDPIRISYATPMEQIEKGVERIRQALLNLR
jgi:bifunctional pyridoxal-dependent enzyme with beta-cystathionase and maltose regulon repressor activities